MPLSNPYSNYRNTQVKTASPVTLIILLYEGAVKTILKGERLLREAREDEQGHEQFIEGTKQLLKAMSIVTELQGILKPEQAPDIAKQPSALGGRHRGQSDIARDISGICNRVAGNCGATGRIPRVPHR